MITLNTFLFGGNWQPSTGDTTTTAIQETYRQTVFLFYYEYSKGDETGFELTYGFEDKRLSDKVFKMTEDISGVVQEKVFKVQQSGTGVIPLVVPNTCDKLHISVSFTNPGESPGNLTAWVIPDSLYLLETSED